MLSSECEREKVMKEVLQLLLPKRPLASRGWMHPSWEKVLGAFQTQMVQLCVLD